MIFLRTFSTRYMKDILKNNKISNTVCPQALWQGSFYNLLMPVAVFTVGFWCLKKCKIDSLKHFHLYQPYLHCQNSAIHFKILVKKKIELFLFMFQAEPLWLHMHHVCLSFSVQVPKIHILELPMIY